MNQRSKIAVAGGVVGGLLLFFFMGKAKAYKPPRVPPVIPPLAPTQANHAVVTGIAWGGQTFADAGAWRAHVRSVYGDLFNMTSASVDQLAALLLDALDQENETASHLKQLNLTHKAWFGSNSALQLAVINAAAGDAPSTMLA